jgi:hypothetical protein
MSIMFILPLTLKRNRNGWFSVKLNSENHKLAFLVKGKNFSLWRNVQRAPPHYDEQDTTRRPFLSVRK